jgi:DNA-binding IscR family transcriptional regulator
VAVQSLVIVARAFMHGKPLPSELDIAERIGCSTVLLKPALEQLKRAGIIARGDSHDMPIMLVREPQRISIREITEALFKSRSAVYFPEELERLFAAFRSDALGSASISLADIVQAKE